MTKLRVGSEFPNHIQLSEFVASILPIHPSDVPFTYHSPRNRWYDPAKATVSHVVLSITPTAGVYAKLEAVSKQSRRRPLCFLHRPFGLDRKAIPPGSLLLASHKRFDEVLTVGYNLALAKRLNLNVDNHATIQGYKQDPERLMGIVAPLRTKIGLQSIHTIIQKEFGVCDLHEELSEPSNEITTMAIVNAFNPEMIERIEQAAVSHGWISSASDLHSILYLTGQVREKGLEAAKLVTMPVACVGHRAAEEWGIRRLAQSIRDAFPGVDVSEVFEDQEEQPRLRKDVDNKAWERSGQLQQTIDR